MPRWSLVILAGGIAIGSVLTLSRNYACAALPACVVVMVAVALLDRVLFAAIAAKDLRRDGVRLLVALTAGVVVAFIPPFRLTPASAFRTVFGIPPPPGITNLTAESRYVGGPGDHVVLFAFHADQSVINELIAKLGAEEDVRYTRVWNDDAGCDWSRFLADRSVKPWDHTYRGPWISRHPPMFDPRFYSWTEVPCCRDVKVIWDAASGFTLVMFGQG